MDLWGRGVIPSRPLKLLDVWNTSWIGQTKQEDGIIRDDKIGNIRSQRDLVLILWSVDYLEASCGQCEDVCVQCPPKWL